MTKPSADDREAIPPRGRKPQQERRGVPGWAVFLLCLVCIAIGRNNSRPEANRVRNDYNRARSEIRSMHAAIGEVTGTYTDRRAVNNRGQIASPRPDWFDERLLEGRFRLTEAVPTWMGSIPLEDGVARSKAATITKWYWKRDRGMSRLHLTADYGGRGGLAPSGDPLLELPIKLQRGNRTATRTLPLAKPSSTGPSLTIYEGWIELPEDWSLIGTELHLGHWRYIWPR